MVLSHEVQTGDVPSHDRAVSHQTRRVNADGLASPCESVDCIQPLFNGTRYDGWRTGQPPVHPEGCAAHGTEPTGWASRQAVWLLAIPCKFV